MLWVKCIYISRSATVHILLSMDDHMVPTTMIRGVGVICIETITT